MSERVIRKNISDQIVDIIREKIIKNEYAEGEKLPGENELAEIYGVSRMTARTVFQKLSSMGFVEIRNGDGTYAKHFNLNDYVSQALNYMNEKNTTEDINEFRYYFEPMCVEIAGKKRSDEDIKKLTSIYEEMVAACNDNDVKRYNEADYKFHRYICKVTNNAVIIMLYELFMSLVIRDYISQLENLAKSYGVTLESGDYSAVLPISLDGHRQMLQGIIDGSVKPFMEGWSKAFIHL